MSLFLHLRARLLLWLGARELARSRRLDRRSDTAMARAERWTAAARIAADRLERERRPGPTFPAGDLLYGSRAIAAHLGVKKSLGIHFVREGLIPTFNLGGVACARRSTLAAHFKALEDRSSV